MCLTTSVSGLGCSILSKKSKLLYPSLHTPSDREMENHISFSDSAPKIKDLSLTVHFAEKELEYTLIMQ